MTYSRNRAARRLGWVVALAERRSCNVCRHELCAATRVNPGGASRSPPKERVAVQQLRPVTRRPLGPLRGRDALRRRLGRGRRLAAAARVWGRSIRAGGGSHRGDGCNRSAAAWAPRQQGDEAPRRPHPCRISRGEPTDASMAPRAERIVTARQAGGAPRRGSRKPRGIRAHSASAPHACVLRRLPSVTERDCGARWIHDELTRGCSHEA